MSGLSVVDRFRGCLLGGAVGDALGAPVEFLSLDEIKRRYGDSGITVFDTAYGRRGAITDDTQMTLFTAEGLIRAEQRFRDRGICNVPAVIGRAYVRWLSTQGETVDHERFEPGPGPDGWLVSLHELHSRRAPGNTCLSALRTTHYGDGPMQNDSKGCGAVMRMAPVGLVANDPFDLGCRAGWITHGHPSGYLAAGYLAQLIRGIADGRSIDTALDAADARLVAYPDHEECLEAVRHARELAEIGEGTAERVAKLGEGWVAEEALAIAIYCALVTDDFRDAGVLAVNHGGDSDSTGAITGNIVGTARGVASIPEPWLDELELRQEIDQLALDLHAFVMDDRGLEVPDRERYPAY